MAKESTLEQKNVDVTGGDPGRVRNSHRAWLSLINTCKRTSVAIVTSCSSPNGVWKKLESRYAPRGVKEMGPLEAERVSLRMELGEAPTDFLLRLDGFANDIDCIGNPVHEFNVVGDMYRGMTGNMKCGVQL